MSLIDQAVAHFSAKETRSITVPEWGVTLYAKNLTLDDKSKWLKRAQDDTTEYMLYAVIFGLTDEQGETVFDIGDKPKLRKHTDPEIVARLASFVLGTQASSEEEREKNS